MKEKLTLRNVAIWFAALLALIVFILSFVATFWFGNKMNGVSFNNIIWGCKSGAEWLNGSSSSGELSGVGPAVLPMIGVLLVFLSAVGAVVVSFIIKAEKLRKIVTLACAGAMLVGGVFAFFTLSAGARALYQAVGMTVEQVKAMGYTPRCPGGTACGILAIIGAIAIAVPQFLKDIKFVK